ncbi:hexameric tyrosine-coordinated heme protein [Desulfonatronum parangueonense]
MRSITSIMAALVLISLVTTTLLSAEQEAQEAVAGQLSLITSTPEEGFQLALVLARKGVTETQRDKEVLETLRPAYAHDPDSLIAASHVVAVHFQTIAAANNYWRDND